MVTTLTSTGEVEYCPTKGERCLLKPDLSSLVGYSEDNLVYSWEGVLYTQESRGERVADSSVKDITDSTIEVTLNSTCYYLCVVSDRNGEQLETYGFNFHFDNQMDFKPDGEHFPWINRGDDVTLAVKNANGYANYIAEWNEYIEDEDGDKHEVRLDCADLNLNLSNVTTERQFDFRAFDEYGNETRIYFTIHVQNPASDDDKKDDGLKGDDVTEDDDKKDDGTIVDDKKDDVSKGDVQKDDSSKNDGSKVDNKQDDGQKDDKPSIEDKKPVTIKKATAASDGSKVTTTASGEATITAVKASNKKVIH